MSETVGIYIQSAHLWVRSVNFNGQFDVIDITLTENQNEAHRFNEDQHCIAEYYACQIEKWLSVSSNAGSKTIRKQGNWHRINWLTRYKPAKM